MVQKSCSPPKACIKTLEIVGHTTNLSCLAVCLNHQRVCIPNSLPSSSKWHHWGNSHQKRGPPPGAPGPHIEIAWEASSKFRYFCEKKMGEGISCWPTNQKTADELGSNTLEVLEDLFFDVGMKETPGTTVTVFLISSVKSALPCCFQPVVVCHGFVAASISSTHQPLTAVIGSDHLLYMTHFQCYTLQGCYLLLKGSK